MTGKQVAESLVISLIIAVLIVLTLGVRHTIAIAEETEIIEPTWSPPPIPRCDKETWDRIREGCDEQRQDH